MIPAVLLLLVVVAYRVILGMAGSADFGWLHNFAPVAAVALCGAVYLPKRIAAILPLGMLFLSDLALNLIHYREPMLTWEILPRYAALAMITFLGFQLRGRVKLPGLLVSSVVGSVVFYVVTNTGSWMGNPMYVKSFSGWLQALTSGLPGYPPTYWFYKHTLISDVLFTGMFAYCMSFKANVAAAPAELSESAA